MRASFLTRLIMWAATAATPVAVHAQASSAPCRLSSADSTWIAAALSGWRREFSAAIRPTTVEMPTLVFFDDACRHTLDPLRRDDAPAQLVVGHDRFAVSSAHHAGSITLPDGQVIPARLVSFAAPRPDGGMLFVMALPQIWTATGRNLDGRNSLVTAVFMHEFTHTASHALGARIDSLVRGGLPKEADDDIIQTRFGEWPRFRELYERERDLLYQAASAPSDSLARTLAARALSVIDRRRADAFVGRDRVYAESEDVFLTMEGTAQWIAYRWLVDSSGGGMPASSALAMMRRGGRRWSQDEGLALLLAISRLAPDPPRGMFGESPVTVLRALRSAVGGE